MEERLEEESKVSRQQISWHKDKRVMRNREVGECSSDRRIGLSGSLRKAGGVTVASGGTRATFGVWWRRINVI